MSASEQQSGAGRREVAYRLFAAEYDDATLQYSDSDEERAPNYVVTPTGARVNRLFVVGVLTEIEEVSDGVIRARVADPSGAFVLYAGQYQPDAVTFLERADPPLFVAVTGKARTYQPEGSDRVLTSIRPESINEADAATRDRWTVQTASHTLDRVATIAGALERDERGDELQAALVEEGVDYGLADGVAIAIDHYGTTPAYLAAIRRLAIQAAEVVADERDELDPLETAPDEGGSRDVEAPLTAGVDRRGEHSGSDTGQPSASDASEPAAVTTSAGSGMRTGGEPGDGAGPDDETEADADQGTTTADADGTDPVPTPEDDGETAVADHGETEETTDAEPGSDEGGPGDFAEYEPDVETTAAGGEDPDAEPADDVGSSAATGELYEYDEEEREEIEEEFGTDFSTGAEVESPGEADIETPTPEGSEPDVGAEPRGDADAEPEPEPGPEEPVEAEAEAGGGDTTGEVDLEDAVVEAMEALDEGDGADRAAVIEAVMEDHGADRGAVEDAIDDALMSGRCYEPGDDRLKAI